MVRFAKPKKDIEEKIIAFGIFSEVFANSPSTTLFCGKELLELGLATRDLNDEEVTRNVCYMVGNIAKSGREAIHPHYPNILMYLKFIIENSIVPEAKDNAIAAACKLAYSGPTLVPVAELLPAVLN